MSTLTTNYELIKPADNEGEWGPMLRENSDSIDSILFTKAPRGRINLPVTSGTYVLTNEQFDNSSFDISGTLTADVIIEIPDDIAQIFIIDNATVGNYTLFIKHNTTAAVKVTQGNRRILYTTGTIVEDILATPIGSYTNDINNGQSRIAQAGTSFPAPASGAYDLDGWSQLNTTTAVFTVAQATGSATGKLARNVTVTTADVTVNVGDWLAQQTLIEGYDCVKYIGNTFIIGFKVKSAVIGIHCISIWDGTSTYVLEYEILVANTWEIKTAIFVGGLRAVNSETNAWGIRISFANICGSPYQQGAGVWFAGNKLGTANQVNDMATNGNVFAIEDVTMNLGEVVVPDTATYEQDLARAQRYYEVIFIPQSAGSHIGKVNDSDTVDWMLHYITKRASPSITVPTTLVMLTAVNSLPGGTTSHTVQSTYNYARVRTSVTTTPYVAGNASVTYANGGSKTIAISARL